MTASSYAAQARSRCCLSCTQKDSHSNSEKHHFGLGTARMSSPQPAWMMWCHRPLTLDQAGFCIPGSERTGNNQEYLTI